MNARDRLYTSAEKLPLVGGAAYPFMAAALGVFVILTSVAVLIPQYVFPGDKDARAHVLQLGGGLIVVGAFYFATVTLRASRAAQLADRIVATIALLGSESEAVRIGAVALLEDMSRENPNLPKDSVSRATNRAQKRAILQALTAAGEEGTRRSAVAARAACAAIAHPSLPSSCASFSSEEERTCRSCGSEIGGTRSNC